MCIVCHTLLAFIQFDKNVSFNICKFLCTEDVSNYWDIKEVAGILICDKTHIQYIT